MKNASLILNAVLLVAVVVLFVLHFTSGKSSGGSTGGGFSGHSNIKFAYVKQDTILKYYEFVKVNAAKLEAKLKSLDQQLVGRQQSLQREVQSYQANVSNLTIGQAKAIEEDLQAKGQNLQMYQEQLSQEMMNERDRLNEELYNKITAFLKEYSKDKNIEVILKFDRTSDVLFANDSLDISKDVVTALNEDWKIESAKPEKTTPAKGDTTKAKK
jgi:outer membrane protein